MFYGDVGFSPDIPEAKAYFNEYKIDPNGVLYIFNVKYRWKIDLIVSPNTWKWIAPNPDYNGE